MIVSPHLLLQFTSLLLQLLYLLFELLDTRFRIPVLVINPPACDRSLREVADSK